MNSLDKLNNGFFKLGSEGVDSVIPAFQRSRLNYSAALSLFGGKENLPASVMRVKRHRTKKDHDEQGYERSYIRMGKKNKSYQKLNSKEMRRIKMVSAAGVRKGALSTFPQDLCRTMILFYTQPGDTIVDPFAGHNSRMEAAVKVGRNYIGQDLSEKFMAFNRARAAKLKEVYTKVKVELHEGDSRHLKAKSEVGDFTITSPPYWNVEDYGNEVGQLGKLKGGYEAFLLGLKKVLRENLRVLKPGCHAAWYVNDIRHKGFIPYHYDVMRLGLEVGFEIWDMQIVDFGRSHRDCFMNQAMKQKIIPKRHEYGIIFRKPLSEEQKAAIKKAKKEKKLKRKLEREKIKKDLSDLAAASGKGHSRSIAKTAP